MQRPGGARSPQGSPCVGQGNTVSAEGTRPFRGGLEARTLHNRSRRTSEIT